jgi:2-hydroxychromene-2-carboxylate isomerase
VSLKSLLVSRVAGMITSEKRLIRNRVMQESKRVAASAPHTVDYFHDVTDPYSHLCAQVLARFAARYQVSLQVHLTAPPPDWAAPERDRLESYSREDAARLARRAGLSFEDPGKPVSPEQAARANALLAAAIDDGTFADKAAAIGEAAWTGSVPDAPVDQPSLSARLTEGAARREELGHYLGGTFHYAGEWYWGVDRLHYLEARLTELAARKPDAGEGLIFPPPQAPAARSTPKGAPAELHYYLSFRSPYTYIAAARAKALADAHCAELKLRYVLPMVMRGLPVPRMKSRYITLDTAREARRLGVPFGKIVDPVGKPVERGYSILPWAREQGRGFEFCQAFLAGVWSQGIDAGSDAGLKQIVENAGLDWSAARQQLGSEIWRAEAEANRAEMMALGVWGVPSFRVGKVITWGQDRLWLIEEELIKSAG